MIIESYHATFEPPAPVLQVSLTFMDVSAVIGPVMAMIDTGADGTFVPSALLSAMGSPIEQFATVRSHLGDQVFEVAIHRIDLVISSTIRLPGIEVISNDWDDFVILGRNVLNRLTILLDGIKQMTRVSA